MTNEYACQKLASRLTARLLWHAAVQRPDYETTIAKFPKCTPQGSELGLYDCAAFAELFEKIAPHQIKEDIFNALLHDGGKDILSAKPKKLLDTSCAIEGILLAHKLPLENKDIYDILSNEQRKLASELTINPPG